MVVNDSKKLLKVAQIFCCDFCHYTTSKKSSYAKHLSTDKHKRITNDSKMVVNDSNKTQKTNCYVCGCGKTYKYDSGYYRHKKKCKKEEPETDEEQDNMILSLILEVVK